MTAPRGPQPTGGSAADHVDANATDHATDRAEKISDDHTTGSPDMTTDAFNPAAAFTPSDTFAPTDAESRPDQPPYAPLPYGTGFTTPEKFGYGVAPEAQSTRSAQVAVARRERRERQGSPVLAVAGLLSLAVAVWAVLGAPAISTTAVLTAGLALTVLVGLILVVRR